MWGRERAAEWVGGGRGGHLSVSSPNRREALTSASSTGSRVSATLPRGLPAAPPPTTLGWELADPGPSRCWREARLLPTLCPHLSQRLSGLSPPSPPRHPARPSLPPPEAPHTLQSDPPPPNSSFAPSDLRRQQTRVLGLILETSPAPSRAKTWLSLKTLLP